MGPVDVGEDPGDPRAEDPLQGQGCRLEDRDLRAGLAGRGGDLETDPAGADDDEAPVRPEGRLDPVAVLDGAQVGARAGGVGDRQTARLGAGGEQERVVRLVAGVGPHEPAVEVQARDRRVGAQVDVVRGVPVARVDESLLDRVVTQEVGLGQRRSLVRHVGLAAEEHDRALVAPSAA